MNGRRLGALVRKDLKEVVGNKMALVPMIVVPLVMAVVLPTLVTVLFFTLPAGQLNASDMLDQLVRLYPVPPAWSAPVESMLYVMLNYSFVGMLVIVPLMVSTVVAANAVTGEKERHTLETLLSTPLTSREFLAAKVLAAFAPAFVVGVVTFALYFLSANTSSLVFRGALIVDSWVWLPVVFLLGPAVSLLGLAATLMVSLKAKNFVEAQQTAALVVLPCLLLVVAQVTGLVVLSPLFLVGAALALLALDAFLILRVAPRFDREKVLDVL